MRRLSGGGSKAAAEQAAAKAAAEEAAEEAAAEEAAAKEAAGQGGRPRRAAKEAAAQGAAAAGADGADASWRAVGAVDEPADPGGFQPKGAARAAWDDAARRDEHRGLCAGGRLARPA